MPSSEEICLTLRGLLRLGRAVEVWVQGSMMIVSDGCVSLIYERSTKSESEIDSQSNLPDGSRCVAGQF
jgi:hypothetical protein